MTETLKAIRERHSARVPFDPDRPVPKEALKQILDAAKWTPTAHNMQNYEIVVVDDPEVLGEMAKIKLRISEEFLKENYAQLSFSREELEKKKVGILAAGFPPDWVDPAKIAQVARESTQMSLENNIRGSPTLLLVFYDSTKRAPASDGDTLGFMSLGCLMQNLWLAAETLGVSAQILSLSATASIEKELKQLLRVPETLKIAYTIRLGYPNADGKGLRVRRNIEDFTHHNKYGTRGI
jgi:nitroreductase